MTATSINLHSISRTLTRASTRGRRGPGLAIAAALLSLHLPLNAQDTTPSATAPQPPTSNSSTPKTATAGIHVIATPRVEDVLPSTTADFHFVDAPITLILDHIAKSYGIVIINRQTIDSRITLKLPNPITAAEAISLLNDTLLPMGFVALEDVQFGGGGGADAGPSKPHVELTIVTTTRNPQAFIPVFRGANPREIGDGDDIRTQIIPLQRLDPLMTSQRIESFLKKDPEIRVSLGARTLIVTDTTRNIKAAVTLIAALELQAAARAAAATQGAATKSAAAPGTQR